MPGTNSKMVNRSDRNIEQGLTNDDFRSSRDQRTVETTKKNLSAGK